jgi:isopenicillin N synthase-like dioxygenase
MTDIDHSSAYRSRYAKNESRFGIVRESVREIPVIDVSPLLDSKSNLQVRQKVAQEIRKACIDCGFFYIKNFGVSEEEMREVADLAIQFFALPDSVKDTARVRDLTQGRGFNPMNSEKITPGYEPDYKEYYDMGLDIREGELADIERGITLWPDDSVLPGYREKMLNHSRRMLRVGQRLMRGFALSLSLEETYFDELHEIPFFNFRPSYYPPARDVLKANKWSCGPHTDYVALTLLYQDSVGGLQVLNLDGDWIAAPPIPGTVVVNIGDMMASWTNDLYVSTPHRVANTSNRKRISLATFIGPRANEPVSCLPSCMSDSNPARYPPISTAQHVYNIMAKALPKKVAENIAVTDQATTDAFRQSDRIGAA